MQTKYEIVPIFEDDSLIVLEKPSGLIVNRSHTTKSITLQDILENVSVDPDLPVSETKVPEVPEDEDAEKSDFEERSGIVHRLDKDTSGIMVVAKNEESFINLQAQFKNREVEKIYYALVYGTVKEESMLIEAPIKRNPKIPFKFAVVEGGKEASTYVEKVKDIEEAGKSFSFLRVLPKTGRTHQIRVHLGALGHYVVGDPIYCPSNLLESTPEKYTRLMLHAFSIKFKHPTTGKDLTFTCKDNLQI